MKDFPAKIKKALPWAMMFCVALLWLVGRDVGGDFGDFSKRAGENLADFSVEMFKFLPFMFILIGLFDIWVPRSFIERRVGRDSGVLAVIWMILLATLQAGPLYASFPVAVILWKKGCALRNVFVYLGAFSALKIPMLTFEVAYLGWRFSLARTAITLPIFIGLAFLLEKMLPGDIALPEQPGADRTSATPVVMNRGLK